MVTVGSDGCVNSAMHHVFILNPHIIHFEHIPIFILIINYIACIYESGDVLILACVVSNQIRLISIFIILNICDFFVARNALF